MKKLLIALLIFTSCNAPAQVPLAAEDSVNIHNIQMDVWALPFKYKEVVVAQAILESGWFKSKNFQLNNNLFGMKYPHTRVTCSDSSINGYAHYPNWHMSIVDYYLLQSVTENIYPTHSKEEYYRYLDRIYSEVGRSYSSQLKDILSRIHIEADECKEGTHKHKKSLKHGKSVTNRKNLRSKVQRKGLHNDNLRRLR
jgi:hypothetical protein